MNSDEDASMGSSWGRSFASCPVGFLSPALDGRRLWRESEAR
jgi:hypothetical protein